MNSRDHAAHIEQFGGAAEERLLVCIEAEPLVTEEPAHIKKIPGAASKIENAQRWATIEPEILGVQAAACAAALSTPSQRASPMFFRRNSSGSILAATASSSMVCSDANANDRSSGERSGAPLR